MRSFTIADLVSKAKQMADMENQDNVSSSEWQRYLSAAYAQLYSILAASGLRYFESTQSLTAAATALPADYMTTLGVYKVDGNYLRPLEEVMFQERHYVVGGSSGEARCYELAGSNLNLLPGYTAGQTYRHYYIPQPTDYSSSVTSTTIDVVTPDGEEFLLWSMVLKALQKEESDVSVALQERELAKGRVEEWAVLRQLHSMRRSIVDGDYREWDEADWRFR